jgi:hypothetical protein
MTLIDLIEIAGALLILVAYAAGQMRRLDAHSMPYLTLNVVGAGILAVIAAVDASWGFLLLEGTWTVVSAVSLAAVIRRRRAARPAHPPARRA